MKLPDVTLVMIETRQHELARMALEESLRRAEFSEVLVFTNAFEHYEGLGAVHKAVPDWSTKVGWSQFSWYGAYPYIKTSHFLLVQWDSWIIDPEMWDDRFLEYDYIGAPWIHVGANNVGNGGFSLRSVALFRFLASRADLFPCFTALDDGLLCHNYRPKLEKEGFKWAPVDVAWDFAFEYAFRYPGSRHFGFHSVANFPFVLSKNELIKRIRIVARDPSLVYGNDLVWNRLIEREPWLLEEVRDILPAWQGGQKKSASG